MKATIFHLRDEFLPPRRTTKESGFAVLDKYSMIGSVEYPVKSVSNFLEMAFELTNSIEIHWSNNKGVTCPYNNKRSTSVGDIFYIEEEGYFRVDSIGFSKVEMV